VERTRRQPMFLEGMMDSIIIIIINILLMKLKVAFVVDDFALNPCVCIELHVRVCVNL
jgi:hypothetical protein